MSRQSTLVLLSLWSLLPSSARADVVLPSGLPPGTEFRVVFTTADGMTADSASVGDYNGFATAEANQNPTLAALGATWYALVSTPTVNVIDNVPSPWRASPSTTRPGNWSLRALERSGPTTTRSSTRSVLTNSETWRPGRTYAPAATQTATR